MRYLMICAVACLAMTGCTAAQAPPPSTVSTVVDVGTTVADTYLPAPVVVADKTQLDETVGRAVNLAYKGARIACELAVDLGQIKGERAARFQVLNRQAYAAVQAVDQAYRVGNAASYKQAAERATPLVAQLLALTGKGS